MDLNLADKSYKFILFIGVTMMFAGFPLQKKAQVNNRESNKTLMKGLESIDSTYLIIEDEFIANEFNNSVNKTIDELKSTDHLKKDAQTRLDGNIAEMEVKKVEIYETRKNLTNVKMLSLKTKALLSTRKTEAREFDSDYDDATLLIVIGFGLSCMGFFTWLQKENAPAIISIK